MKNKKHAILETMKLLVYGIVGITVIGMITLSIFDKLQPYNLSYLKYFKTGVIVLVITVQISLSASFIQQIIQLIKYKKWLKTLK